jgi:hypothetical protein
MKRPTRIGKTGERNDTRPHMVRKPKGRTRRYVAGRKIVEQYLQIPAILL